MLATSLQNLGLSKKEAAVYLASLELGSSSAQQIAEKSGVNRATTYVALESLKQNGMISVFEKNKLTYFVAEDPEHLFSFLEDQKQELTKLQGDLKNVLPQLKVIFKAAPNKPIVKFYEGKDGLLAIRDDFLRSDHKSIESIYCRDNLSKVFSDEENKKFTTQRNQKNIFTRAVYNAGPEKRLPEITAAAKRFCINREHYSFPSDITLYGDKVALASLTKEKSSGIIIEDKNIATTLRSLFNLVWDLLNRQKDSLKGK